jgi:hypothetical protein
LVELSLDGNPLASRPGYFSTVIKACESLTSLDNKPVTAETRRIQAKPPSAPISPKPLSPIKPSPYPLHDAPDLGQEVITQIETEWKAEITRLSESTGKFD